MAFAATSLPAAEPLARVAKSGGGASPSAVLIEIDGAAFDRVARTNTARELELPLPGGGVALALVQPRAAGLFAPDAEITVQDDVGPHARAVPVVESLVGEIVGERGSSVQLSRVGGAYFGFVTRAKGATLSISPADASGKGLHQITANRGTTPAAGPWCGQEEQPGAKAAVEPRVPPKLAAVLKPIDVAVDADYELYKKMGFDEEKALAYIAAVFESTSAIYERDLGATMRVVAVRQWTTPRDPYRGASSDILFLERTMVRANQYPARFANADAIHVLGCGRVRGGVAFRDTLSYCDINTRGNRVGFSDLDGVYTYPNSGYTWDVGVIAHEIGHNVGSPHTHCYSPPIDVCYIEAGCAAGPAVAQEGTIMSYCNLNGSIRLEFSQREIDLMRSYLDASPCLPGPVAFSPDPPVVGKPLTITYDPAGRVLEGAATVWLMRTENDFASGSYYTLPMVRSGAFWQQTYTVPAGAYSAVIGFHNGAGTYDNYSNRYWRQAVDSGTDPVPPIPADRVAITPDPPIAGRDVTIVYTATGTTLAGAGAVEMQRGLDGWKVALDRLPMTSTATDTWTATWPIPADAKSIEFDFTDGTATWDNNNQDDWHFRTVEGVGDEWMVR